MAFGSIELTTISRAQDYSVIKQNEDNKGILDQTNSFHQVQKNENQRTREVHRGDDVGNNHQNEDAREKGHGEYFGDGGKNRQGKNSERVIVKGKTTGFDIKI